MSGIKNIFYNYNYNRTFIETGSYYGDGIQKALDAGFENIISIEITPKYYELCKEKFKDYPNVKIILGDTVNVLPEILKNTTEACTIWVDAHYTEPSTNFGTKWCPLMEELENLKNGLIPHTILIDDLRVWTEKKYDFNIEDIKKAVLEINPNYTISFDEGFVANDVLVAEYKVEEIKEVVVEKPVETPVAKKLTKKPAVKKTIKKPVTKKTTKKSTKTNK